LGLGLVSCMQYGLVACSLTSVHAAMIGFSRSHLFLRPRRPSYIRYSPSLESQVGHEAHGLAAHGSAPDLRLILTKSYEDLHVRITGTRSAT